MWEDRLADFKGLLEAGDIDAAIAMGQEAMRTCETELGRDTVEYARCVLAVSVAHHYRGMNAGPGEDTEAALQLSTEAYALAERIAGPDDPRLVEFAQWHAEALIESGNQEGALRILEPIATRLEQADTVDADRARVLSAYGKILHRLGKPERRDQVLKRLIAVWEKLIETDPGDALDHRRNLAATHNNLCFYLFQDERYQESIDHGWRAFEHYEQCHDGGLELAPSMIEVMRQNVRNSYLNTGSENHRVFTALAKTLLHTPGRRAMWEALADELSHANEAFNVTDADIARAFLHWLREDQMPEPYANLAITQHMLPKLRRRLPESTLLAMFPMSLALVEKGERSLADALDLCAESDREKSS